MDIDRQRITTVLVLEALGYGFQGGEWMPPAAPPLPLIVKADAMHGALMRRADVLGSCTEGSDEETGVKAIVDLIEAYEAQQWPLGTNPAGSAEAEWSSGLARK